MLGADVGKPSLAVGDTFDLGPRRWVVSGILTTAGTTFDSEIWAKREIIEKLLNIPRRGQNRPAQRERAGP